MNYLCACGKRFLTRNILQAHCAQVHTGVRLRLKHGQRQKVNGLLGKKGGSYTCKRLLSPLHFLDGSLKYRIAENGCWLWIAHQTSTGYGLAWWEGRLHKAHRISYEIAKGKIANGLSLDHLCRVPLCINPEHLEPVTHTENVRRGAATKLTVDAVRKMREHWDAQQFSQSEMGRQYGVSSAVVCNIVNRKTWKNV